jgi:phosphoribosylaminoimidazolecarboxamide formyltransferase/IMP cyclohydrolase
MSQSVAIKNALISVYYKDNLEPIIKELSRLRCKHIFNRWYRNLYPQP